MRAWLFVLAVLATFQPIVQVASTEESKTSSLSKQSILSSSLSLATSTTTTTTDHKSSSSLSSTTLISDKNMENINKENREKPDPATLVEIEKNLLSLFGFKKRPKVDRTKVIIPEAMKQLYAEIMGHELVDSVNIPKSGVNTKSANTVRSFTHEDSKIDDRFLHHHRFRLFFNVSSIPKDEKLKAAELTLNRHAINDDNGKNVRHRVLVYDIIRPGIKGKREPIFLLIDSKTVRINSTGSISLDVLPAVQRWLETPKRNYGLLIHVSNTLNQINNEAPIHHHIRLRRSIKDTTDSWSQNQPLLFTYTDDGRHKPRPIRDAMQTNRPRRAPSRKGHRRKEARENCQRRPLYVDFSDVGWSDWIVAPPGYEAFYCHGECQFPIPDHLNSTNHAVVQTLVNSINPSLAPRACCVPTQLASISMLYLDDQNKVVLKNYQDMTVVGCGCR